MRLLFSVGVIIVLTTLGGCQKTQSAPRAQDGVLDVSGWDFRGTEVLHLNGEWAFYWNQLLTPTTLSEAQNRQSIAVPGMWNNLAHPTAPGETIGPLGYATYVLKVRGLTSETPQLAVQVPPVASAYELYWFSEEDPSTDTPLLSRGKVHATEPVPQWAPDIVTLPNIQSDAVLLVRVSNQHFGQGGFFYPFVSLHESTQLKLDFDRLSFLSISIIGVILMMALYHFGLFAVRREDIASLIFAGFCLLMATQAMAYSHWVTLLIFTELEPWCFNLELALMSLTSFIALPLFVSFLTHLFAHEFPRWFMLATWVIGIGLVTVYPFLALESNITSFYGLVSTIECVLLFACLWRAIHAKREGARLVLVGFLLLFGSTTLDFLITQQLLHVSFVFTPLGLLGFILAQSTLLSRRFASAYRRAEHLTQHLQSEVETRTRDLELKTREAVEASQDAVTAKLALESAHQQLQLLDRQKTSFFQNISHELRTPLTLILNPVEQALKREPQNEELEIVLRNGRRLLKLVNQLLNFQKIQAGKMELKLVPIDAVRFVSSMKGYFSSACAAKHISFTTHVPERVTTVCAEVDALEKIVFNFLSNALKFTPNGGAIELHLSTNESLARFSVRDTGPGIPESARNKLFKVFSQLDQTPSHAGTGSGLGLALARELAQQMNGSVGVDSDEKSGSTFWVDLPIDTRTPAELESPDPHAPDPVLRDMIQEFPPLPERQRAVDPSAPLLLVVDDLPDMLRLITKVLEARGYQTLTAQDGQQALALAKKHKPHLIVTDWMMPHMTGPDLIQAIREDHSLSGTPVTLLTAKSDEDSRVMGAEVGADAFVGKPFNEQELVSTVRNLLALKENERALADAYRDLKASSEREMGHMHNLLTQAEKLASLGQLIAGIGHEIANPVSLANLTAEEQSDLIDELERMLMTEFDGDPSKVPVATSLLEQLDAMRENLANARIAVGRLKDVSLALRTQSRRERTPSDVLISEVIEEALVLVGSKTKHHQITCELDELPPMTCFRTQIGQVLTNILANAADAVSERVQHERQAGSRGFRGRIEVRAAEERVEHQAGVTIAIADNGPGIAPAIEQSIFEEFFTTKAAGAGTGLGLSMSLKMVKRHGGTLQVGRSEKLGGAEFRLWLPLSCPESELGQ